MFNIINMLRKSPAQQHGAVLLVMLVILIMGGTAMLLNSLNSNSIRLERDRITADALAQAKEALIGYASSVDLSTDRLGDLPCPDLNNDGIANDGSCGTVAGSNQARRLGRLPWKTLKLPDLRDGSGERLWYAVSNNFKKSTHIPLLNSDTLGTITVRSLDGSILNDGTTSSGAVALLIAPGEVLQRTDKSAPQDRSATGINSPENYLDIANGEDNANFTDSLLDGFIQGKIKDTNNKVILNDQILVITQENIMQPIQKRVAGEVKNCLDSYATAGNGRYPWATPLSDITNYLDETNTLFGRIPDSMIKSKIDSSNNMPNQWTGSCQTHTTFTPNSWWLEWRELVFYGLSDKFKPNSTVAPDFFTTCAIVGNCISINNSSSPAKYVVIISGNKLSNPDQTSRNTNKTSAFYYLEGGNENATQNGTYTFTYNSPSAMFNDSMVHQ